MVHYTKVLHIIIYCICVRKTEWEQGFCYDYATQQAGQHLCTYVHNNSQQVLKAKACLDDVQRRIPHPSWHSMSSSGMVQKSCTLPDQPAIIKCR